MSPVHEPLSPERVAVLQWLKRDYPRAGLAVTEAWLEDSEMAGRMLDSLRPLYRKWAAWERRTRRAA